MKHLYLFYFVITFLSGVVSLGIGGFLYAKTKERLLWYCLLAYSAFTLFVVLEVMLWYIRVNLPMIPLRAFHHATAFASRLSLFTSAVFVHYLFAVPHAKFKNIVFGTTVVIMSIPSYILLYMMHVNFAVAEYTGYTVSLVMYLYILLSSIVSFREVQQERRSLAKKVVFLLGISLLAMIAHMLLEDLTELRFFPLIYCGTSIMFTHHFLRDFATRHVPARLHAVLDGTAERVPVDVLFEQYNLSPREQEVVPLILQGYSNQQIGDTLSISLSTVKKHITSIFLKCDVKSRFELIALFKGTLSG